MKKNKFTAAAALALIAIAIFLLWRQFSTPRVNLRPSSAVGEVLADELGRMLGTTGRVVLIGRGSSRDGGDASSQQIASLQTALKRRALTQSTVTEWLPRPPAGTMDLGGVSPEQFLELIDKNKDANSFVVFAGLPPLSQDLAAKIAARSLKLLAVCGYNANVRHWLEGRALLVAVVPRPDDLPAGTSPPQSPIDWFRREFQMLTPENVGQLGY